MKIEDWIPFISRLPEWLRICWFGWVVAGAFLLLLSVNVIAQKKPTGTIAEPLQNQVVARTMAVQGSVEDIPDGSTVWLAVRVGDLWWPKEPRIHHAGSKWSANISEGGNPPAGRFSIVLLLANPTATKQLEKWFRAADYSGLRRDQIAGITLLDEVAVKLE